MMKQADGKADAGAALRARNRLIRSVREQLRGKNLDSRELARELVISAPGHPEKGRLYINLATAEVSLRLPAWAYLGYLDGHGGDRDPDEPRVDADKIVSVLTGPGYSAILVPPSDAP
jgi:hypothetical protein